MTLDDRIEIQGCLIKGMTFKKIAERIGKVPMTLSKEVKPHRQTYKNRRTLSRFDEDSFCLQRVFKTDHM